MDTTALPVNDNKKDQRFEIVFNDGKTAFIQYEWRGTELALLHTEVPQDKQGAGYAAQLSAFVLDKLKSENRQALNYCPYISGYIKKHPRYAAQIKYPVK